MTERLHLPPRHRQVLEALLREHLPAVEVRTYGSRVNGRSDDGNGLDLVLRGPGLERVPHDSLADFEEAVRASNIPFLVEAHDWTCLPERFHWKIEREHVVLTKKEEVQVDEGWREHFLGDLTDNLDSIRVPVKQVAYDFGRLVRPITARASEAIPESSSFATLRDTLLPKLVSGELRITARADDKPLEGRVNFCSVQG